MDAAQLPPLTPATLYLRHAHRQSESFCLWNPPISCQKKVVNGIERI
jgi:hypothetical protein